METSKSNLRGYSIIQASMIVFSMILPLPVSGGFIPGQEISDLQTTKESIEEGRKMIVLFEQKMARTDLLQLRNQGIPIVKTFNTIPAVAVRMTTSQIQMFSRLSRVQKIYEDLPMHILLDDSVGQIGADQVHTQGIDGSGVKVCIVDSGVDDSHFALNSLINEYDFVNGDSNATDDNGHGTHVAGIVASTNGTYTGVAKDASLMAAKVMNANGSGYSSDVIAGIEWCVLNGADVINMSLGGGMYPGSCDDEPVAQASNAAVDAGVSVFASSGNNGRTNYILAPACASKVISVGAVNDSDSRASYSNGSPELDIVAPGTYIASTYPGGSFAEMSGTSMASPHAAGVAALLLDADSLLTTNQIRTVMRSTAVDLGSTGFDSLYGHGRIDANAAVTSVLGGGGGETEPPEEQDVVFTDTFQTGSFSKWTTTGWTVESPGERPVPNQISGNKVAHADRCSNSCSLTMKDAVDLSGFESAKLSFWRYVDRSLDAGEYLEVEAFNGSSWKTLAYWTNGDGDDDIWHQEAINLAPEFLVSSFKLRFKTKESSSLEEVEVDDVIIEGSQPGNNPPNANAGEDQTLRDADGNGREQVILDGLGSQDDTAIVSYEWKEGGTVLGSDPVISVSLPVGMHTITLTVEDDEGETDTDGVLILVEENQPPIANGGDDQITSDGDGDGFETVTLDGTESSDPDGSIVQYEWYLGPKVLGVGPVITATLSVGSSVITLNVTDNGGAVSFDSVLIGIENNQPPTADAGDNQSLSDGDGDGTVQVTLDGTGSTDDGGIVSYLWKEGSTVLGSGAILVLDMTSGTHVIELTVTDNNSQFDADSVTIDIATNERPIADAGSDQEISDDDGDGSEDVFLDGSQSNDPDGVIASYEWYEGLTLLGSGQTLTVPFDVGQHTVTLTVEDNAGATDSVSVLVDVTDNQSPTSNAGADQEVEDTDNNGSETVTLNGTLSFDSDGSIISYEWKEGSIVLGTHSIITTSLSIGEHVITLKVTDNGGESHEDDITVLVSPGETEPPEPTSFSDDFQSGLGNWINGGTIFWIDSAPAEEQVPGSTVSNRVAHAQKCRTACTLTMKDSIDLSKATIATLSFWRFVDRSIDNGEYLRVEGFDGNGWNTLFYWTNRSGDDDNWNEESLNLPTQYLHDAFKVRFVTQESSRIEEVEIDDVSIEGI